MKRLLIVICAAFFSVVTIGAPLGKPEETCDIQEVVAEPMEAIDIRDYWQEHPDEDPRGKWRDIGHLALVVDAVCPDGSDEAKICVMEVVCNRVGTPGFGSTIEAVANQPYQWSGYSKSNNPSKETKELAKRFYYSRMDTSTYCPIMPRSYKYFDAGATIIVFRSEWNSTDYIEVSLN